MRRAEIQRVSARLFHGMDETEIKVARLSFTHWVVAQVFRETVANAAGPDCCYPRAAHVRPGIRTALLAVVGGKSGKRIRMRGAAKMPRQRIPIRAVPRNVLHYANQRHAAQYRPSLAMLPTGGSRPRHWRRQLHGPQPERSYAIRATVAFFTGS